MTGRTSAVLAGAALCIAVTAIAVCPLLPHHSATAGPSMHATPLSTPQLADLGSIAVNAATRALARPQRDARVADCGRLDVLRTQTSCASGSRCQVELIGTLHTNAQVVPIALTVSLADASRGWRVVEVAS
jgi:hypothetical protein